MDTTKLLIPIFAFFIAISLAVMSWVAINTAENNKKIASIDTAINIQIPKLISDVKYIKRTAYANSQDILLITEAYVPRIEVTLDNYIMEHKNEHRNFTARDAGSRSARNTKDNIISNLPQVSSSNIDPR